MEEQAGSTFAIHVHHVDPGFERIRSEINVKLGLRNTMPRSSPTWPLCPATNRLLPNNWTSRNSRACAVHSYLARTILWHTFAYGDNARGISPEQLKLAVCSPHPSMEPPFLEQARVAFVGESIYLDDKPGAPLRFMVEASLATMIIRRRMADIDARDVPERAARVRNLSLSRMASFTPSHFRRVPMRFQMKLAMAGRCSS